MDISRRDRPPFVSNERGDGRERDKGVKGEGFDVKVPREILRLRKQDKDERDEQELPLDLYLRATERPARRKQRRRSAKQATNFSRLKEGCVSRRLSQPSTNATSGRARRSEAIRRASTSVAGPKHCELRSRWPSSGRREPRASCHA